MFSKNEIDERDIVLDNIPWQFDRKVSNIFDTHIRKSIPYYDELHELTIQICKYYIKDHSVIIDIGTATGEIPFKLNSSVENIAFSIIGIDNSLSMIEKAIDKCKLYKNTTFFNCRIEEFNFPKADIIISAYTLQFIPIVKRTSIINRLYDSLNHGGILLVNEKIICEINEIDNLFILCHEKFKMKNNISREEIEAKKTSLINVMQPISIEENIKLLKKTGFNKISSYFQWLNFYGLLAIKS